MSDAYWKQPIAWNVEAERLGKRRRVFCASMADVFEDRRDLDGHRDRLWDLIALTPHLDWLLLTKRPQNTTRLSPFGENWPANVWLGATAENQRWLQERVEHLRWIPAKVRFLSCEPLLGPLDFSQWTDQTDGERFVHWVIAGGESGHHARSANPEWFTSIRDQCVAAGIKFHFKQWGNWRPVSPRYEGRRTKTIFTSSGDRIFVANVGKKSAGRILDGRTWDEFPQLATA